MRTKSESRTAKQQTARTRPNSLSPGVPEVEPPRIPMQLRSRASFERMMVAAEALLVERGSDDFTLNEVGRMGKVSIGSIYCRFNTKDELIQAVHSRVMERIEQEHAKLILRARRRGRTLDALTRALVEELADLLKSHAPIMRAMMLRAPFDTVVQARGHRGFEDFKHLFTDELLVHRAAIRRRDPEHAVSAVFQMVYATLARELGFGMREEVMRTADWTALKVDVATMAVTYLMCDLPTEH